MRRAWVTIGLLAALAAVAPARADEPVFGVADDAAMQAYPGTARAAATAGFRFARAYVGWDEAAPTRPGRARNPGDPAYRWATADRNLAPYAGSDLEVMVQLWHVPAWANGGAGPTAYATDPRELRDFAYALSRRYPYVRWWLPVNEPNATAFALPATVAAYEPQLRAFSDGIKAADPADRVAAGSTNRNLGHPEKDAWLWARTLAEHHAPMDAYAVHPYPAETKPVGERHVLRMDVWDLAALQRIVGVPVMVMEFGWSTVSVSEETQARWLPEAIHVARCTPGLARFALWGFHDHHVPPGVTPSFWTRFGLLRADGSHKPAYATTTAAMRDAVDCAAVAAMPGAPPGWPERSQPTDAPPAATTGDAVIGPETAVELRGSADPNGTAARAWFEYRVAGVTASTPGVAVAARLGAVDVAEPLPALAPQTLVEYRTVVKNAWKTATGEWRSLTVPTPVPPPPPPPPAEPTPAVVAAPPPPALPAVAVAPTRRPLVVAAAVMRNGPQRQLVLRLGARVELRGRVERRRAGRWIVARTLPRRVLGSGVRRLALPRLGPGSFRVRLLASAPAGGRAVVLVRRYAVRPAAR